jgi:hypothetical protein
MKRILAIALLAASFPASAALVCGNDDWGQIVTWRIGDQRPDIETDGAFWCVATGAELKYVQQNYTGLRMRLGRTLQGSVYMDWDVEDAAFIINNL